MPKNYRAELVGVLGSPVAENPTGAMQEAAFAALGLNWRYLTIEVKPEDLGRAIEGVRAMGFAGLNLTIPHKVAVIPYLDALSREAEMIGAVNTVRRDGERLIGENTDGRGFLRALKEDAGLDPAGKTVVLLGAGGAARAIATELILAGFSKLTVVNRSDLRGRELVHDLQSRTGAAIEFVPWPEPCYTVSADADVLVNATSVGLYPAVEAMPQVDLHTAGKHLIVCDAVFNPAETMLLNHAKAFGLRTLDGLSMLVYQGVIGFEIWTGRKAPEKVMKEALSRELS
ncbi:MAG: shikimate dehydrogenase [Acidobacteriota bacterium]